MLIRSFRLGDYAFITRIWEETGLEQTETETLDALARQLAWDSDLVMIAEYEGQVAGVIVGTIDGTRGYFYRLAVDPKLQGHGLGRKLVEALEKRFRQRGVTRVFIMVNQDNKKVLPFYSSLGYDIKEYITLSKKIDPESEVG
ncbi:putative N-acetyltransferase YhbS [Aneurinibacillus soli]|uniref:Acetyltransferase YpeA n=1 Tax=Aneurinibacillus soli TaxID=1500254 RepID=A0A0U5BFA4_9BACL|nr:GNAT family N-acetyltransferase [Aneurinibacillus soli]PYE61844.1 putative N-acetyltransferase YhbS [Aneurinibacillus soli]BAU29660.1 Acetyltransferase YpeA [Aneurinibacillus soli]